MVEYVLVVVKDVVIEDKDEFNCVIGRRVERRFYGVDSDGVRLVRKGKNIDEVRDMVKWSMEDNMLVEFIGLGWRCVFEGGKYYWSKIRDIEEYEEDLRSYS